MKDFLSVFVMLILVFGSMTLFVYLMFYLDYFWFAIIQIVLSTAIILFCIKYFRSHRVRK